MSSKVRLFQGLDFYLKNRLGTFPLPSQPDSVSYNRLIDHTLEFNLAGARIIRNQVDTFTPHEISITGIIPSKPSLYPISPHVGGSSELYRLNPFNLSILLSTPEEVVEYFTNFLETSKEGDLTFFDLQRRLSFFDCKVQSFSVDRSASSSKFGYRYTLVFRSYGSTEPTRTEGLDYLKTINTTLRKVASSIATINENISTFSDTLYGPLQDAVSEINRVGSLLDTTVTSGAGIVYQAKLVASALISSVLNVARLGGLSQEVSRLDQVLTENPFISRQALLEFASAWSFLNDLQDTLEPSIDLRTLGNALEEAGYEAQALYGYLGASSSLLLPSLSERGAFINTENGRVSFADFSVSQDSPRVINDLTTYINYTLRLGESLYDVARNTSGDLSDWAVIANHNKWASPYEKQDGTLAKAGDIVRVPTSLSLLSGLTPASNGDPFMADLLLTDEGDLGISSERSDLRVVGGEGNFVQAISNRLKTRQGELFYVPDYGIPDIIGEKLTDLQLSVISIDVADQLATDQRVLSVGKINPILGDQGIDVTLDVTPVNSESISLTLPIL